GGRALTRPAARRLVLMDRYLRKKGVDPDALSALDRLQFLGTRTMGALTYHLRRTRNARRPERARRGGRLGPPRRRRRDPARAAPVRGARRPQDARVLRHEAPRPTAWEPPRPRPQPSRT